MKLLLVFVAILAVVMSHPQYYRDPGTHPVGNVGGNNDPIVGPGRLPGQDPGTAPAGNVQYPHRDPGTHPVGNVAPGYHGPNGQYNTGVYGRPGRL